MKRVCVYFLLALPLGASVLEVGPISLTGSGVLTHPDYASYGGEGIGGLGLMFHASGSNSNGDTVSISTQDIEINDFEDSDGQSLVLGAGPGRCLMGYTVTQSLCSIWIDGITGYGAFSDLGLATGGLVQVYSIVFVGQPYGLSYAGALLAEAHITNTLVQVTSVTCGPGSFISPRCPSGIGSSVAMFSIFDPPSTNTPEPRTTALELIGLLAIALRRQQQIR